MRTCESEPVFYSFILDMKTYTKQQVNKKYAWKYIDIYRTFDYTKQIDLYEIRKVSETIKENMTLWEDVGTDMEFCR